MHVRQHQHECIYRGIISCLARERDVKLCRMDAIVIVRVYSEAANASPFACQSR